MIKLDNDHIISVVIICTDCPHWSAIRFDMDEAHTCAVKHEQQQHAGKQQAYDAARVWRRRQRKNETTLEPA